MFKCQITWMSPILNVKWMKWTLNRINYYFKTLHTNLHYFNVSVGQCERHLSNSIDYCKYYQPSMDTLAIESPLASIIVYHIINIGLVSKLKKKMTSQWRFYCQGVHRGLIIFTIINWMIYNYIYIKLVCKMAVFFFFKSHLASVSQTL